MNYMIFDGHCDTPITIWRHHAELRENDRAISLNRAKNPAGYAQFFAFCTAWIENGMTHTEQFRCALAYLLEQFRKNEDLVTLCRTAAEAENAMQAGKEAAFLSIEGAEAVDCDEGLLEEAYASGVRMVSLVWNIENALTGSCMTGSGLTQRGKSFFRRAQKLGMIVDVSHLSERGFWDMAELAERPIVASHSNSFAVCAHPRNLTDEQFRAICQLGGTLGLNLVGSFLSEDAAASFEAFRRHLDHLLDIGGDGHIAIGMDLDGTKDLPAGFTGVEHIASLADYLTSCGYSDAVLKNLFGQSLMEVVKTCII